MYIFIDESGIHNQEGKSSIALIYLLTDHLEKLQKAVITVEQKLGIKAFHWSHSKWRVRNAFISAIAKEIFSIKIAFVKNPFRESYAYEYALSHLVVEQKIIALVIDGKKGKGYERRLKKVLRDKGVPSSKLRTAHDESYPALRVADAIAGLVRYRDENPDNEKIIELYQKIQKKILATFKE